MPPKALAAAAALRSRFARVEMTDRGGECAALMRFKDRRGRGNPALDAGVGDATLAA